MKKLASLSLLFGLLLGFVPAFALADDAVSAATNVNVGASASGSGTAVTTSANVTANAKLTAAEGKARDRGNQEIDRRVQNLNELATHIGGIKNLSDQDKATIQATVTAQVNALTALKAKIAADADAATVKADVQSITDAYRIYALLIPQVRIIAAADRIVTIANEMTLLSAKLQARVSAAQSSGADVSAAANALTDYNAKVADGRTQAQAAVTAIAGLTPDQGDKTKMAANTKALQDARAKIVAGQKDLQAARKDVDVIVKAVKGKPVTASTTTTASSTTSATTGQ